MQTREKLLAGAFGAVIAVGWLIPTVWTAVRSPVNERETTLRSVKRRLDTKEDDEMKTLAAITKIAGWKKRALSEDALTAQRVYQVWLTQLADEAGWRDLDVRPGTTKRVGPGSSVSVSVEGRATVAELAEFLRRFEAAGLLHAIESSNWVAETTNPDVPLDVTVVATALSLPDGGSTPLPYAEFSVSETSDDPKTADVKPSLGDVSQPFDVEAMIEDRWRIATVKKTDDDGRWILSWDGEAPSKLPAGTKFRTRPLVDQQPAELWDRLADNGLFAIPRADDAPMVAQSDPEKPNEPPVIADIESGSVLPGDVWETGVSATDPDGDSEAVKLTLRDAPRGAVLSDGKLTFESSRSARPSELEITVVATDENGEESTAVAVVTVLPDPEQTTKLVGAVRIDNVPSAMFIDYQSGQRIVKRVGDEMVAGRFQGTIESIGSSDVVFVSAEASSRLDLGDVIADRQPTPLTPTKSDLPSTSEPGEESAPSTDAGNDAGVASEPADSAASDDSP